MVRSVCLFTVWYQFSAGCNMVLSYHKRTIRRTTQEQQQEGQYRRGVKQDSSLTRNNNIKDTGVMVRGTETKYG